MCPLFLRPCEILQAPSTHPTFAYTSQSWLLLLPMEYVSAKAIINRLSLHFCPVQTPDKVQNSVVMKHRVNTINFNNAPHFIMLHGYCFLGFLHTEGLWQVCAKTVYRHHFLNTVCSICVCHAWEFSYFIFLMIIISVTVACDQ